MTSILSLFRSEPTVVIGSIGGLIDAVIVLAVTFGLHVSQAQTQAIDGVVLALGLVITLFVIRSQVSPVAKPPII